MKLPDLIYLDTAFIVGMYELEKGVSVPVKVVKKSNLSGGFSAGIFSTGASMEEEKEFPISSRKMYDELVEHLEKFPHFNLEKKHSELPELFWTEGGFGGGRSTVGESSADLFRLQTTGKDARPLMNLATNDAYFVSGYDQLSKYGFAFTVNFLIRARILVRLLCMDGDRVVGAPMVIIKTSNSHQL